MTSGGGGGGLVAESCPMLESKLTSTCFSFEKNNLFKKQIKALKRQREEV